MPHNPETERYVQNWKKHTRTPKRDNVADTFEYSRCLIALYNRLFDDATAILKRQPRKYREGATLNVIDYLSVDALATAIEGTKETSEAVERLKDFIRKGEYNFVLDKHNSPNPSEDAKLLARMESKNKEVRIHGLLDLIYYVRNNITHGQKDPTESQLPLLWSFIPILERVTWMTEEKLRA
jgi:hypothetical protein